MRDIYSRLGLLERMGDICFRGVIISPERSAELSDPPPDCDVCGAVGPSPLDQMLLREFLCLGLTSREVHLGRTSMNTLVGRVCLSVFTMASELYRPKKTTTE